MLSGSFEEIVRAKDKIRIEENSYPIDDIYGIDIYEAIHMNTNKKIHITSMELIK